MNQDIFDPAILNLELEILRREISLGCGILNPKKNCGSSFIRNLKRHGWKEARMQNLIQADCCGPQSNTCVRRLWRWECARRCWEVVQQMMCSVRFLLSAAYFQSLYWHILSIYIYLLGRARIYLQRAGKAWMQRPHSKSMTRLWVRSPLQTPIPHQSEALHSSLQPVMLRDQ